MKGSGLSFSSSLAETRNIRFISLGLIGCGLRSEVYVRFVQKSLLSVRPNSRI